MTPQQQIILNWLGDEEWHCPTEITYMYDLRKRISELRRKGYNIQSVICDKRCGINHSSGIVMRRLVSI